ncbi:MAG: hypothetical protein U1E27_05430 [Kiritimatiellia bacterium]|nr:hypothetical protein [Kiritimatiellia bacterium]
MTHRTKAFQLLRMALLGGGLFSATGEALDILDFSNPDSLNRIETQDVAVSLVKNPTGPALRMETGTRYAWPSVYLKNPSGWDFSGHGTLSFTVLNRGKDVYVYCRVNSAPRGVDDPDAERKYLYKRFVRQGETAELSIPFLPMSASSLTAKDFPGMRGIPIGFGKAHYLDRITEIVIYVNQPIENHVLEISALSVGGTPAPVPPFPENPFPFVDEFGQYKHRDWPGKTRSVEDLVARRKSEETDLSQNPPPADWNIFGGWETGPQLRATGFFRTEKADGKWFLVDPSGRLFFSHGVTCVDYGNVTFVEGRESWFESLPTRDRAAAGLYMAYSGAKPGHPYHGKTAWTFRFGLANILRKYGADGKRAFAERTTQRLPSWGLNTIGNWSQLEIKKMGRIPYTANRTTSGKPLGGGFIDVYDPQFRENFRNAMAADADRSLGDPWCIGYFVDNELPWSPDATRIALITLAAPETQPAKHVLITRLRQKYRDIQALNSVWETSHPSWEALRASTVPPDREKARGDLEAFTEAYAERYFGTIREVFREFAPHQLYLGCRFAGENTLVARVAARYCDVVSFNVYAETPSEHANLYGIGDVPVIIGEFHFGAPDRGVFFTGLGDAADQADRARKYRAYVRDVLRHPRIVGCHWFQYQDQPCTARALDGENYQVGFVDIADTPYPELIEAARDVGAALYSVRASPLSTAE